MIIAFTILGFLLRLGALRTQGTYWFDEQFSVHFASLPLVQSVALLMRDVHPTFYYLLLHFWIALFGASETAVRSLSLVFGTLAIPAVAKLTEKVFGKKAAAVAALLTALSPTLLFQSAEARMYPLLVLLAALSLLEFLKLVESQESEVRSQGFLKWAVLSSLMLFTHLTAATPFLAMTAVGVHEWRGDKARLKKFLAAAALATVPFLAWFVTATAARIGFLGQEWQLGPGGAALPIGERFMDFFATNAETWQRSLLLLLFLAAVCACFISWKREGKSLLWRVELLKDRRIWILGILAALPFFAFAAVSTSVTRYYLVAYPACAALVAGGLAKLFDKRLLVVLALVAIVLAAPIATMMTSVRIRYDAVAKFIEANERDGDVMVISWFPFRLSISNYYHGRLPIVAIDQNEGVLSLDERLILHAGQVMDKDAFAAELDKLGRNIAAADRVFLLTGTTQLTGTPVEQWFVGRGWKLEKQFKINAFTPSVLLLDRPR